MSTPGWYTGLRPKFETWIKRARVYTDLRRHPAPRHQGYSDPDTDWLWDAFKAGAKTAHRAPDPR